MGLLSGFGADLQLQDIGGNAIQAWWQNALNQKATDKQNAYNSPLAQRERLVAAGYSPQLFYNQGSTGNQGSAVEMQAPQLGHSFQLHRKSNFDIASLNAGIRQANASADETEQRARNEKTSGDLLKLQYQKELHNVPFYPDVAQYNMSSAQAKYNESLWRGELARRNAEARAGDVGLKGLKKYEIEHYNQMRQFGMEKGDPLWIRGLFGAGRMVDQALQNFSGSYRKWRK